MNKWWGYLHINDTLHVKVYFDEEDLREAWGSFFVRHVYGPWECNSREEALLKLKESLK